MAARSITIEWAFSRYVYQRHDGIRVCLWITCQEGFPDDKIFAYRLLTTNPTTGQQAGFFDHVCSPTDLAEYGADEPIPGQRPEWFRLNYVDCILRSMAEVEQLITDVRADVLRLKRTLDTMDTLQDSTTETLGTGCQPSESSESLSSSSSSEASLDYICGDGAVPTVAQSVGFGAVWSDTPWKVTVEPGWSSALLLLRGFDFTDVPDDAIITGFEAQVQLGDYADERSSSSLSAAAENAFVLSICRLYHPEEGPAGQDKADPNQAVFPADLITLGDDEDAWDYDWLAAIVKRPDFGLSLAFHVPFVPGTLEGSCSESYAPGENDPTTVIVASVLLTVYYRCASSESL